ncbi:DNA-protecting protein DprA [Lichenicola cladoniae]|uniref:DNA-protecting protein DprA n=1 Tax=Lichenicola cladoniae TaxID=1484109 RepID=A0A6M8HSR1_9PROT|nr:DNA-processing protein DprA [Lichenicola cladoniae]NPD65388.1 DNA-protecting protein DprA [Acetobacteraceae bacterium]QKE91533.1 DNA-protecting protein DprA [Lichenicola cladoniae]
MRSLPASLAATLRLVRTDGVGPATYRRLMQRFSTPEAALDALPALARNAGRQIRAPIPSLGMAEDEIDGLAKLGGRFLVLGTPDYPPLLAQLADAPPVLAVLGDPAILHRRSVAMVGSRNASSAGLRIAEALAAELGGAGLIVVSGLARGIDGAAHRGAMHVGPTVAAIAGGLDQPYPPEHTDLQARIALTGCVVAEAPLGTAPQSRHFPRRNRIIAGLSLGCIVVEAAPRSGSLITANLTLDYGRELFAVPGSPLDPRSRGSNDLLRGRAHLTETAEDVLRELPEMPTYLGPDGFGEPLPGWGAEGPEDWKQLESVRVAVLQLLSHAPTPVDDLVRRCQFSVSAVLAVLTELELAGRVESHPGNRVGLLDHPFRSD